MVAYVISEVEVLDEDQAGRYRELAAASIARHGGRYLARGAAPLVPEGARSAGSRIVIVEFPTMARLLDWYASADYAPARAIRETGLSRRLLFVDGGPAAPGLGWPEDSP
ncbi:MAG: DUF1330 domain-containing protein [Streptosporangiaceae bacterium]